MSPNRLDSYLRRTFLVFTLAPAIFSVFSAEILFHKRRHGSLHPVSPPKLSSRAKTRPSLSNLLLFYLACGVLPGWGGALFFC